MTSDDRMFIITVGWALFLSLQNYNVYARLFGVIVFAILLIQVVLEKVLEKL